MKKKIVVLSAAGLVLAVGAAGAAPVAGLGPIRDDQPSVVRTVPTGPYQPPRSIEQAAALLAESLSG